MTRARELLGRSRTLPGASREAAAQWLAGPSVRSLPTAAGAGPQAGDVRAASSRATEEALGAICADLALRDLNLVDTLLAQLEDMESCEEDADRLDELYRLDHLAARLRRNAENLRVLAGRDAGVDGSEESSLIDVIRGGMSSIDQYQRVAIGRVVNLGVVGFAAEDVGRLLAELLDNATKSSARHGIKVWLDQHHPQGTTSSVLLPAPLVCELPNDGWPGRPSDLMSPPVIAASPGDSLRGLTVRTRAPRGGPGGTRVPRDSGSPPVSAGTTPSGLPHRVARSLREAHPAPPQRDAVSGAVDVSDGHRKLLADLDAFTEGDRAARDEHQAD